MSPTHASFGPENLKLRFSMFGATGLEWLELVAPLGTEKSQKMEQRRHMASNNT